MAKENKDNLDVVIKSKDEATWITVIKNLKASIESYEKQLKVDKIFLETAKSELKKAEKSA